jgi:N-acyl homoserine lactone hydrolase
LLYTIGEAGDIETDKAQSIASMEKIRRMIATYNKATFFINRYKEQTDTLKIVPAFYD